MKGLTVWSLALAWLEFDYRYAVISR